MGTGKVIEYEDDYVSKQGHICVKFTISISDLDQIVPPATDTSKTRTQDHSFEFEKELESFLISNWNRTPLSIDYLIYEHEDGRSGNQFRTDIGPIDILSIKKDHSEFLVIELKRDRASDSAVGQTLRYMAWVRENLCRGSEKVRGCIIAQRQDKKMEYALMEVPNVEFLKYEIDFRLVEEK